MYAHTIIILKKKLICSFSSIRDFDESTTIFKKERPKNTRKKKKTKKNRPPFLQTKTRPMMLRRRQSHHRLLFLFWCFFLLLVSFLFLPSRSNAQEEEGKCPLDIAKIDLSGLGNACGNADDPGTFFISLLFWPAISMK